jgi:hypothetical protein
MGRQFSDSGPRLRFVHSARLEALSCVELLHTYVPPSPEKMQAAMAAGKITVTPGAGTAGVRIADYEKAGDSLVLTLESAAKAMRKIDVNTWLDAATDKVTLDVQMQSARRHELSGHGGAGHSGKPDPGFRSRTATTRRLPTNPVEPRKEET